MRRAQHYSRFLERHASSGKELLPELGIAVERFDFRVKLFMPADQRFD